MPRKAAPGGYISHRGIRFNEAAAFDAAEGDHPLMTGRKQ